MLHNIKNIPIESFVGKVINVQQNSETQVRGEGGGGYYTSMKIDSTITHYLQIFLVDEQGHQKHIKVCNWDFPVCEGQQVEAILVCDTAIILRNKDLNTETRSTRDLKELCKLLYFPYKAYGIFSLLVLSLVIIFVIAPLFSISVKGTNYLLMFSIYGGLLSMIFYMVAWRKLYFDIKSRLKQF